MNDTFILAIESSCDETSVSIIKNGCDEIATVVLSQMDIHANYGGVVPEIASRHHIENITLVIDDTLKKASMTMDDIDAIAVTYGPGLIGSLLIGVTAAKTLAYIYNKPLVPVHHIAGHIYANNLVKPMKFPLIALVVSGGHTELVYMKEDYSFEKIGGTLDDAVGEAYDKVARVLDIPYPGGPIKALKKYNVHNLIVAGGVSANKGLRESLKNMCLKNGIDLTVPEIKYCTDNAAMIGAAGYFAYKLGRRADISLNAKASDELK